jgi:hypothetical protein
MISHDADPTARTGRIVWYLILEHWSNRQPLSTSLIAAKTGLSMQAATDRMRSLARCPGLPLVQIPSSGQSSWAMNYHPHTLQRPSECSTSELDRSHTWQAALVSHRWICRGLFDEEPVLTARDASVLLGKSAVLSGRLVSRLCGVGGLPGYYLSGIGWTIDLYQFEQVPFPNRETLV